MGTRASQGLRSAQFILFCPASHEAQLGDVFRLWDAVKNMLQPNATVQLLQRLQAQALKGFLLDFGADVQHYASSAVTGRGGCEAHSRYLTGHLLLKKNPIIAKINTGT